jgi:hypothetical protein
MRRGDGEEGLLWMVFRRAAVFAVVIQLCISLDINYSFVTSDDFMMAAGRLYVSSVFRGSSWQPLCLVSRRQGLA